MNFDDKTYTLHDPDRYRFTFQTQDEVWVGRAGVNYKF